MPRKDTSHITLRLSAYDAFYFYYLGDGFSNLTANESKIYRFYQYALPHGTCFKTVLSLQIFSSTFVMNRPQCCLMLPLKKHVFLLKGSNSDLSVILHTFQNLAQTVTLYFIDMIKVPFLALLLLIGEYLHSCWSVGINT